MTVRQGKREVRRWKGEGVAARFKRLKKIPKEFLRRSQEKGD